MKISKPIIVYALVITLVICMWLYQGSVSVLLAKRKIPQLRNYEKIYGISKGGLFSNWLLISAKLDQDNFNRYSNEIKSDCDKSLKIPNEAIILTSEENNSDKIDGKRELFFKQKVSGKYLDWWDTDKVRNGVVYVKNQGNACRYEILFDNETLNVYIYWSYS